MAKSRLTYPEKIKSLRYYAHLVCMECHKVIDWKDPIEFDHYKPVALGGDNSPENVRPIHKWCHDLKTNGKPHTSVGSDKQKIAKTKRLMSGPKEPKGNIPNRGFDKRFKRKFNGEVVSNE